jgi:hypothetical protein
MELSTYTPPERTEGDSFKPSEHVGQLLIVKVVDHKHIQSTTHKPEGGPGVILNVCNLDDDGKVARDILWMNGALVDGLKNYVGQTLVIKLAWAKSASGREYLTISPADTAEIAKAQAHVAKGDPFAETVATVAPASAAPPF